MRESLNALLCFAVAVTLAASLPCSAQSDHPYKYFRIGNSADAANAAPRPGYALMGGGTDLDEAFKFLCDRAGGGDFIVLRASGDDDYNPYIRKLCPALNSVATLIMTNRAAAEDPFSANAIRHAGAVFIAGGDQANYINFWMHSPVQDALNEDIVRGVPLGGTSAGLAVMGEWAYTSQGDKPDDPNLTGKLAMSDPYGPRNTLVQGFLHISQLDGIITDTHFAKRDRMGRLLTFIARLNRPDGKPLPATTPRLRGIGVQERAAFLLEPDGTGRVVGNGDAYFIDTAGASGMPAQGAPLTFGPYDVLKVEPGHTFNLKSWTGQSTSYNLNVQNGQIKSTQAGGTVY
ncbi:MAG TPA: cyanophycinase [Terracidiphilus sp.]